MVQRTLLPLLMASHFSLESGWGIVEFGEVTADWLRAAYELADWKRKCSSVAEHHTHTFTNTRTLSNGEGLL